MVSFIFTVKQYETFDKILLSLKSFIANDVNINDVIKTYKILNIGSMLYFVLVPKFEVNSINTSEFMDITSSFIFFLLFLCKSPLTRLQKPLKYLMF